jgi:hypothetical protein
MVYSDGVVNEGRTTKRRTIMGDLVTITEAMSNMFDTRVTSAGKRIWFLRDHAQQTPLSEMVRAAAENMNEDTAYEYVHELLSDAAVNGLNGPDEIADMVLPDSDYETLALTGWLAENIKHAVLMNELCEDGQSYGDIDRWISDAQQLAYEYARQAIIENWPTCSECDEPLEYYEEWLDEGCRVCYPSSMFDGVED